MMQIIDISAKSHPQGNETDPESTPGKIIISDTDKQYFSFITGDEESIVYAAEVYSEALKRNNRLVHVTYPKDSGKRATKLYFRTDIKMDPHEVLQYYHCRFQIEFLYRDRKHHDSLIDSQVSIENKLHFQFNASLASINIAKAVHWFSIPK